MAGETVTRIRAGASTENDRYGNPIPGEPAETTLRGAFFAPGGTQEPVEAGRTQEPVEAGRTAVITEPEIYFPGSWPDIQPDDRLRIRGDVYEVTGDPADWKSPWASGLGGLAIRLRKVDG